MQSKKTNLMKFLREGTPPSVIDRYMSLQDFADDSSFGELENNLVVVDTEATGLSLSKDELIQIAAAKIMNGKIVDWYVTFVDPGVDIPEDIEHLTHISNDDVIGAPDANDAVKGLVDFAGDAVMIAHNIGFDKSFLIKYSTGISLEQNI